NGEWQLVLPLVLKAHAAFSLPFTALTPDSNPLSRHKRRFGVPTCPAITGEAGAMHRSVLFAGKPAPTKKMQAPDRMFLNLQPASFKQIFLRTILRILRKRLDCRGNVSGIPSLGRRVGDRA
ncbi:hypothetical protein, partial [Pseudomonas sp. NY15374]|uniref:hypothetical protein n=1 Tax=Pseudomonas sp. NY15374 TaxID=3400357 RepID=UPI003A867844